jgi:hypothetical protein
MADRDRLLAPSRTEDDHPPHVGGRSEPALVEGWPERNADERGRGRAESELEDDAVAESSPRRDAPRRFPEYALDRGQFEVVVQEWSAAERNPGVPAARSTRPRRCSRAPPLALHLSRRG